MPQHVRVLVRRMSGAEGGELHVPVALQVNGGDRLDLVPDGTLMVGPPGGAGNPWSVTVELAADTVALVDERTRALIDGGDWPPEPEPEPEQPTYAAHSFTPSRRDRAECIFCPRPEGDH